MNGRTAKVCVAEGSACHIMIAEGSVAVVLQVLEIYKYFVKSFNYRRTSLSLSGPKAID